MDELKRLLLSHRHQALKISVFAIPILSALVLASLSVRDLSLYQQKPAIASVDLSSLASTDTPSSADPLSRSIRPIFGAFESEQAKAARNKSNIPTTSLNLTLRAIFFSTDTRMGAALISKQGRKKAKLYRIGNTIMTGVKLEQVLTHSVVIDRNGSSESLRLPRLGKRDKT